MSQQLGQKEQNELKGLYQQAQTFLKTGEIPAADAICAGVLDRHPDDANFLCLSAHALIRLEQFDDAGARLDHALALFPHFDRGFDARGDLLLAKGDLPAAAEAYQEALKLNPNRQLTRQKLGRLSLRLGDIDAVQKLRGEFFEASADNKDIEKASKLEREEKFEDAEKIYREILMREPDNVSAMRLWAGLGVKQKQYVDAEVLLRRAVEKAPDFGRAWRDLYNVQTEQEKYPDAIITANTLIKLDPRTVLGQVLLASAHAANGDHQQAILIFDEALEIAPDNVGALCGKGNTCRTIGRHDDAVAAYRRSIAANPYHGEPYWSLANLKTFQFEPSEVDDMLALVGDERIKPEDQVQLNNALGHEFHNRKDYDRAFEHIDRGNKLRREHEYYDPIEQEVLVDEMISVFTKEFLTENAGWGDPDAAPIFIIGLPRSGSTLIEQILASHSAVEGTHELRDLDLTVRSIRSFPNRGLEGRYPKTVINLDADKLRSLGAEYIQRTRRHRSDPPFFTDKNPNNFRHVGLLHLILPNAKIINARRHPLDSCFGSYKQLFASGQSFTYDLVELGEYYLQYQRLMDHWHDVLPGKVLDVQYEDNVADLEGQVKRILAYCELDWEDNCLRFHESDRSVKTASSEQVRQPIYTSSLNAWRHYENHLGDLIEVLEPLLEQLPESDRPTRLGGAG